MLGLWDAQPLLLLRQSFVLKIQFTQFGLMFAGNECMGEPEGLSEVLSNQIYSISLMSGVSSISPRACHAKCRNRHITHTQGDSPAFCLSYSSAYDLLADNNFCQPPANPFTRESVGSPRSVSFQ